MPPKSPNKSGRFGKPIKFGNFPRKKSKTGSDSEANRQGANAMVSQFINVRKNYREKLKEMTSGDIHAQRFFCENDCAFIFDVAIMKTLIRTVERKKVKKPKDAVIILFQGLKKAKFEGYGCAFGTPTLIAAVYVKNEAGEFEHVPIEQNDLSQEYLKDGDDIDPPFDGFQHPGNGNSGTLRFTGVGFEDVKANAAQPPVVVSHAESDEDDTDFVIRTKMDISVFQNWTK